jgi:hypothetical protein
MVEIASDRPLFKTILVEMAYSIIYLHNRVNKSRIAVLLLCPEELELGKHLRCVPWCDHRKLLAVVVIVIVIVPNSPITYNLSNFITSYRSLGDKIIEVLLYFTWFFSKTRQRFKAGSVNVIYFTLQYPLVPKTPKTPTMQQVLSPQDETHCKLSSRSPKPSNMNYHNNHSRNPWHTHHLPCVGP